VILALGWNEVDILFLIYMLFSICGKPLNTGVLTGS
jgi:hypothetical protein